MNFSARVYKLSKQLRDSLKAKRAEQEMTQAQLFAWAVSEHLDGIRDTLLELGFEPTKSQGPVRVMMDTAALKALHQASAKTGAPQTILLQACLIQATQPKPKPKRRRSTKAKK